MKAKTDKEDFVLNKLLIIVSGCQRLLFMVQCDYVYNRVTCTQSMKIQAWLINLLLGYRLRWSKIDWVRVTNQEIKRNKIAITIIAFKHSDVVSLRQPARYCV